MTPKDYLAQLRAENPVPKVTEEMIPASVVQVVEKELGLTLTEYVRDLNAGDYGARLLDALKPRLPQPILELFNGGLIAVSEIGDPSPNAYVKNLDNRGFAIVFHSGLRDFIYRVARAFATRSVPMGDNRPLLLTFDETVRVIAEIFWWYQETEQAFGPQYPIEEDQMKIASRIASEAECFVLAHEIGHVLTQLFRILGKQGDDLQLALLQGLEPNHTDEHYADQIGLGILLGVYAGEGRLTLSTSLSYASTEFLLQIFNGLEVLGFEFNETHPPASHRLNVIRDIARRWCGTDTAWKQLTGMSESIGILFNNIIEMIRDPSAGKAFFEHQAAEVEQRLLSLLDECSGGVVPDYMTFYSKAGEIFGQGYPERLYHVVAQHVAQFIAEAEAGYADLDEVQLGDAKKSFQKFKLLVGFVKEVMSEPAASVFKEAFRESRIFDDYNL